MAHCCIKTNYHISLLNNLQCRVVIPIAIGRQKGPEL
jgi:hypothetical protein